MLPASRHRWLPLGLDRHLLHRLAELQIVAYDNFDPAGIVFHRKYPWLQDLLKPKAEHMAARFKKAHQNELRQTVQRERSHFFESEASMECSCFKVEVKAKKTRTLEAGSRWVVSIDIYNPPWGVPSEEAAVLEERLRVAGV